MNSHPSIRLLRRHNGFTLVELMLTILVAGIIAGLAAPNMRSFVLNSRLTSTSNDLLRSLQAARSEAAKTQSNIVVCMSANAETELVNPTCDDENLNSWIVFQDTNRNWQRDVGETVSGVGTFDANKVYLLMNNSKKLSFGPSGFANPAGSTPLTQTPSTAILICDSRGNVSIGHQSAARGLEVQPTGRARIMRSTAEIGDLLTTLGSTCPP